MGEENKKTTNSRVAIVKKSELGNTWDAATYVNKKKGKDPYILNGFQATPVSKGSDLKKAVFLKKEDADMLNALGKGVRDLVAKFNREKERLIGPGSKI